MDDGTQGGNGFDALARQNQPTEPAPLMTQAQPDQSGAPQQGNGFDLLAAGHDIHLPGPHDQDSRPGFIDPADTGVLNSLKRNTTGLLRLPAHVIHAFTDSARDGEEQRMAEALGIKDGQPIDPRGAFGAQVLLGIKRLIVDPMYEQHKQAQAYAQMYDKMTPEQRQEAEKNLSASDAQHLANMHHIASVIPLLGPAAGDMVDRMYNGDVSGGLTDLLFNIVTAGAMKKLAGKVKGVGPGERVVAGEPVQTLASQEGSEAAANLERTAKATGSSAPISRFVKEQRGSLRAATGNVAQAATEDSIKNLNPSAAPTAIARASNFEEASDILRAAARPKLEVVDKITNGRLSQIWDERDALLEKAKTTNQFSALQGIQKQLADLSTEEQNLYSPRNLQSGQFQKFVNNAQREAAVRAGRVWQQANAMEELHSAIEGAGEDGAQMAKRIQGMDPGTLDKALGGNATHVAAVKEIARLMSSGAEAAKVGSVLKLVKFITEKGSIGTSAIASRGISTILTSRAAANALATGIKAGAAAPVIAQSIDKILRREETAE